MPTLRPIVLTPSPSVVGVLLGGVVGTVLFIAFLYAAPVFGVELVDVPRAIGGVFTRHSGAALGIGSLVLFVGAAVFWPSILLFAWSTLPGGEIGLPGALMKGAISGVVVWIVSTGALVLCNALNRPANNGTVGAFAIPLEAGTFGWLLVGCVMYALSVSIIAAMEAGISPLDAIGWKHHYHAAVGPRDLGAHRSTLDVGAGALRE